MAAVMVKSHCNSSSRFDWSLFLKKKETVEKCQYLKKLQLFTGLL